MRQSLPFDCGPAADIQSTIAPSARRSYHPLLEFTIHTTVSITGASVRTPKTVASAAPDSKPNSEMATATASSKKLLAPMTQDLLARKPAQQHLPRQQR